MGVFEFDSSSESQTDNKEETTVSVLNHGGRSLRMTIPNQIAEDHEITSADHLYVKETETGFEVAVMDV